MQFLTKNQNMIIYFLFMSILAGYILNTEYEIFISRQAVGIITFIPLYVI